jgi:FMN phosphatase YigB (HAD superfamily)
MDSRLVTLPDSYSPEPARDVFRLRSALPVTLSALILDLDNVLVDVSPWRRWLLQLLNRIGLHTHYQAFFCAFEQDYLGDVYCGRRDYWEALRAYLLAAGVTRGRVEEVLAAAHGKVGELWASARPLPGVMGTLADLTSRGVRLALLTNAVASTPEIEERLQRLGVAGRFATILSSRDLGFAKPMPESYSAAITALNTPAEAIGFVGHSALELAGAGLAGLTTFAINHVPEVEADYFLERFEQLQHLVLPMQSQKRVG